MKSQLYVLAIDLGTSGPKVALVSEDGEIAACTVRAVPTLHVGADGAEQNPEAMWSAVSDACRQVIAQATLPAGRVLGIVCESQYFSLIPVDAQGRELANCLLWLDKRGGPYTLAMYGREPEALGRWMEVHRLPPIPTGIDSLSHMLFVQAEQPEVYEKTHAFVEPMDYITARLTGTVGANACTAFPLLLTDNRRIDDVHYDGDLISMSGLDAAKLPPLLPIDEAVGELKRDIAEDWGLNPGIAVFAGMNDTQAVAVGAETFRPGVGGINIGTTTQILAHVDEMRSDLEHAVLSMPSPLPGRYTVMAENGLGGKLIEHFMRNMVFSTDGLADHSSADAYAGLEKVVAAVPPGSGRLLFLPWLTGAQSPVTDPNARGAFLNMSLDTTRASMLRAILEGVAFNLRWLLPAVESLCGSSFEQIRCSGGGAVSEQWSQIMADVMDRRVLQVANARYLNSCAAAFLGFRQAGLADLDQVGKFCPIKRSYDPLPANRDIYARMFEQFVAAYESNRGIFDALNADTGWGGA